MNDIKNAGIAVSVFLILAGVLTTLIPKGNTEKVMKLCVSLSLVFMVITSFSNTNIDLTFFEFYESSQETNSPSETNEVLRVSESVLSDELSAKLKEKGYIVENLRINMDISDNDSIVINSIVYKPENSLESEKIKQELYELTLCKNIQEENHERNKS